MVTYINKNTRSRYAGNSTEEKPMDVQNGSVFFEMDTGLYYMFDAENKVWHEQMDNGSGGGGSYKLPPATETKLGGVKAPAKTPDQTVPVGIGDDDKLYVAPSSGGASVQSDWNVNDPENPAYIKNRICYDNTTGTVLFPGKSYDFSDPDEIGVYSSAIPTELAIEVGKTYRVSWDGVLYDCVASEVDAGFIVPCFGNLNILLPDGPVSREPFAFAYGNALQPGMNMWIVATLQTEPTHNIEISEVLGEIVKLSDKYLPIIPESKLPEIVKNVKYIDKYYTEWTNEEAVAISKEVNSGKIVFFKESYEGIDEYRTIISMRVRLDRGTSRLIYAGHYGNIIAVDESGAYQLDASSIGLIESLDRVADIVTDGSSDFLLSRQVFQAPNRKYFEVVVSDDGILGTKPVNIV